MEITDVKGEGMIKKLIAVMLVLGLSGTYAYTKLNPHPLTDAQLRAEYDANNDEYFGGKLPKDVIIDWSEYNPDFEAATSYNSNQQKFMIKFNEKYVTSAHYTRLLLLHELCHVETWERDKSESGHGSPWRACMARIDMDGAFRHILIEGQPTN
jgi:hypothetical protein